MTDTTTLAAVLFAFRLGLGVMVWESQRCPAVSAGQERVRRDKCHRRGGGF